MKKTKKEHYIDNKKMYSVMIDYRRQIYENEQSGFDARPVVPEYLGECFIKIAQGLAQRPNFINYTYKEDMIGDGIINCVEYCHNFDPEKSRNPFSYFTQIIYFAFLRRIEREKKQSYIKHKLTEIFVSVSDLATLQDQDNVKLEDLEVYINENSTVVEEFEEKMKRKKSKNKSKKSLEIFME